LGRARRGKNAPLHPPEKSERDEMGREVTLRVQLERSATRRDSRAKDQWAGTCRASPRDRLPVDDHRRPRAFAPRLAVRSGSTAVRVNASEETHHTWVTKKPRPPKPRAISTTLLPSKFSAV